MDSFISEALTVYPSQLLGRVQIYIKFRPEIQWYSRTKQIHSQTKQKCQAFHFVCPLPPLQLNVFQNVRNVHVGWTDDAAAVEV